MVHKLGDNTTHSRKVSSCKISSSVTTKTEREFNVARNSFLARAAGPLNARARASTPSSRRCKFSDLVPSNILQNLYFDQKYLRKLTVKTCKIWHSGKEQTEISVLIERTNSLRSKQNERENRIM